MKNADATFRLRVLKRRIEPAATKLSCICHPELVSGSVVMDMLKIRDAGVNSE